MKQSTIIKSSARGPLQLFLALAFALPLSGPALAATTAVEPLLLVQMRNNARLTPVMLQTMSTQVSVPLQVSQNVGKGSYLIRPTKPINSMAIRTVTTKLSAHPNVLSANVYQKSAPAYVLAPAGHRLTLNATHLIASASPLARFHWQQITGASTGQPSSTSPALSFVARQAAPPATTVTDPAAVTPGDLSSMPQTFDCAISAASIKKNALLAPTAVTKQDFLCNGGGGGATQGSTPPDTSLPGSSPGSTTPPDSSSPGAGTPSESSNPGGSTPPDASTPSDSSSPPDTSTPSGSSNTPPGGTPNFYGGGSSPSIPSSGGGGGGCGGGRGGGHASGGGRHHGGMDTMSVKKPQVITINAASSPNVVGYRLVATDQGGTAHVRNIYIKVQSAGPSKAAPAKAAPKSGSALSGLLSKILQLKR